VGCRCGCCSRTGRKRPLATLASGRRGIVSRRGL
jgi:hypothetical protein